MSELDDAVRYIDTIKNEVAPTTRTRCVLKQWDAKRSFFMVSVVVGTATRSDDMGMIT